MWSSSCRRCSRCSRSRSTSAGRSRQIRTATRRRRRRTRLRFRPRREKGDTQVAGDGAEDPRDEPGRRQFRRRADDHGHPRLLELDDQDLHRRHGEPVRREGYRFKAANNNGVPLMWASLIGRSSVDIQASAVAVLNTQKCETFDVWAEGDPWLAGMPAGSLASYNDYAGNANRRRPTRSGRSAVADGWIPSRSGKLHHVRQHRRRPAHAARLGSAVALRADRLAARAARRARVGAGARGVERGESARDRRHRKRRAARGPRATGAHPMGSRVVARSRSRRTTAPRLRSRSRPVASAPPRDAWMVNSVYNVLLFAHLSMRRWADFYATPRVTHGRGRRRRERFQRGLPVELRGLGKLKE